MSNKTKSGQRVGDWFLWIDAEVITASDYRRVPLVTLRDAIRGGEVLSTVVGSLAMAAELRNAAKNIEEAVSLANGAEPEADQ